MELGNLIFGHSRGKHSIPDRRKYGELFSKLLEAMGADSYGEEFSNDVFEMHRYCWCDGDKCPQCGTGEQPNFLYKPTGFRLTWYKYPMRDAYTNQEVTPSMFRDMMTACIASLAHAENKEASVPPPLDHSAITAKIKANGTFGAKGNLPKSD